MSFDDQPHLSAICELKRIASSEREVNRQLDGALYVGRDDDVALLD
jgi:hypothetical protein